MSSAAAPALPEAEQCKMDKMRNLFKLDEATIAAEFADTKDGCHITSTECHVTYPPAFMCQCTYPLCANKVTAHVAQWCQKHGPFGTHNVSIRCKEHAKGCFRKPDGPVWQPATWGKSASHTKEINFDQVGSQMMGRISAIPTRDETKRRMCTVRLDDQVLLGFSISVQLVGFHAKVSSDQWVWRVQGSPAGRLCSTPADNLLPFATMENKDDGQIHLLIGDASGATILVNLTRALEVLYTLRNGF